MNCDLCGKEAELFKAVVEGSHLVVCKGCSAYGTVTGRVQSSIPAKKKAEPARQPREEVIESVVSDFGKIIKRKREELGMSQKDFARKIAERESALHKMETGVLTPTLERARQLEKQLGLKLVEEVRSEPVRSSKERDVMTLGDFIKIKTRKKQGANS